MNDHSVRHGTFTLERSYAASPAVVFAAWSERDTKAKWFAAQDDRYSLDFRVGGTEAVHGGDGTGLVAKSEYHDIVPSERIVYSTSLFAHGVLATVSLTTVQFEPDGAGTRLVLTEHTLGGTVAGTIPTMVPGRAWSSPNKTHSWTAANCLSGESRAPATGWMSSAVR